MKHDWYADVFRVGVGLLAGLGAGFALGGPVGVLVGGAVCFAVVRWWPRPPPS